MKYAILFTLFFNVVISQNHKSQFKMMQDEIVKTDWDIMVNGFRISENLYLITSHNNYDNLIISVTEVPVLLKYKFTEKLSILAGSKFDFHKN